LPLHLTEYVRERLRHRGDRTLSAFLNIFHHRMLALFHRAWSVSQPTAQGDRPGENRFDDYVGSIIGIALPALRQRDVITDAAKLQYAGLLACPSRNREGLCAILAHYFGHPVRVEEFVGEWLSLPDSARWRLGVSEEVSSLGRTSVLGARTWRCDHKFRVVVGPLASDEFRSLLPGNPRLERLAALVRAYTGDEFEWDVKLVLAEGASRQVKLGRGDRLGLYTQLGRAKRTARRDDVIIHPVSHRTQRSARKHHD